jgi:hypothetical protein
MYALTESATWLAPRPASSIVAHVASERLPTYVAHKQARAIINAATTHQHRVLRECVWQSGGGLRGSPATALRRGRRVGYRGVLFDSAKSADRDMSTVRAWRIVTDCSRRRGVYVEDADRVLRAANGRDFRHGAAVNQVQQSVPLSEVQQLGHARRPSKVMIAPQASTQLSADRVHNLATKMSAAMVGHVAAVDFPASPGIARSPS